ncbi:MAG: F0F1 ATP synthase subunit delta [Burkholderiales bacterium]|nr:F0F1 ATP synthase subunit delta [Burkholderiales bacterium]
MATLSNNDIARAIYGATKDKNKEELSLVFTKVAEFLDRRRLLSRAPDILKKLNEIINKDESRIEVKVLSAKKISEKIKSELVQNLSKRYKVKEIVLLEKIDEKLLGGIRLEINDEVIDLTVKKKISKLQEHLIKKYE